jgi:hypothetical protein
MSSAIYLPLGSVPWFKPYTYKPSLGWDDPHKVWYLLLLGNQVKSGRDVENTFCAYPFAWEPPYTTLRYIPLEVPVIHATFASAGGTFWVFGLSEYGFCFQPIPGASEARVLSDDDIFAFMQAYTMPAEDQPVLFPGLHKVPRRRTKVTHA